MTNEELAKAAEEYLKEDAKRPPADQLNDLIRAGVIDEQGHVLIPNKETSRQKNGKIEPRSGRRSQKSQR